MAYTCVRLEQKGAGIYLLTIDRPKVLNALSAATVAELESAAGEVCQTPDARVLLVTGAGDKAFVAGADIHEMRALGPLEARGFSTRFHRALRTLERSPIPVIAVVNGYCLGGGFELALACDWIVAGENAVFGLPEVGLGVIPGAGGTQRLARIVGRARAIELIATGRQASADEAREIGIAVRVYPRETLLEEALRSAREIASKGPLAVRWAKEAVHRGLDLDLDNACLLETQLFGLCFASQDQKEGMTAFAEKRAPMYRGV
jgi:enoyl-CoA hydratase